MNRGFPSLAALLGLVAVAGYQNRDKLKEMLDGLAPNNPNAPDQNRQQGGLGQVLGGVRARPEIR